MNVAARDGWYPLSTHPLVGQASPPPAAPAPPADIRVGDNGYIHGVDGMLDQIASALTRHAVPALREQILPVIQADQTMQARVGQAAGSAMAQRLLPWIVVGVSAVGVLAAVEVMRYRRERAQQQASPRGRR